MTEALAARPAPLSRVWSGSKVIAEDVQGDDLGDVLELHSDAYAWWVMSRADARASRGLLGAAKALDLDDLAIRDLLADDHRAKYEELGQSRLVLTNAVTLDRENAVLTAHPVSMVITDRALICLADSSPNGFHPAQLLSQKSAELVHGGVEHALQFVVAAVINTYENVVEWLEDCSDQLANALFEERPLDKGEQIWAFRVRAVLTQLRRLTDPMRSVLDELVNSQTKSTLVKRKWAMIQEQHHRVANAADALREVLGSVFDTSLTLADLQMNSIMKKLTGWAGIIAVPTLVTGFVGMNVDFPLDGTVQGFWVYLVIMVAAIVWLFITFRRKDWI
ncbi:MAG: CorA family divalent cation transporter [Propionibacteriaceae bacterium]